MKERVIMWEGWRSLLPSFISASPERERMPIIRLVILWLVHITLSPKGLPLRGQGGGRNEERDESSDALSIRPRPRHTFDRKEAMKCDPSSSAMRELRRLRDRGSPVWPGVQCRIPAPDRCRLRSPSAADALGAPMQSALRGATYLARRCSWRR